ncbi:winged helix-turn-helix domain-containing protein [Verticiella sediminum]|uniref:winged helix-turn-helix domain-containing protein n=1 Tax=Verticiella sediminum TaxID=1247510 RepID=UPI00319E1030
MCRYVCERLGTPVILLTAVADPVDRIAGLEIGADDYVVKPFDPRELIARIRSVLRRHQANGTQRPNGPVQAGAGADPAHCYAFGAGWTLDTRTRALCHGGEEVPIGTTEFHLLRVFLEQANRVLSRGQLLDLTQRNEAVSFDRSIDSQISRLRKKLEQDPRHPVLL